MAQLILNVKDNQIGFLLDLLQKFDFVEIEKLYDIELSDDQINILEGRLTKYKADPDSVLDWDEVNSKIKHRYELKKKELNKSV